jgi:hypothetical protein
MTPLKSYLGPGASRAAIVLLSFALIATAHAETWNLEVETAQVVAGKSGEGNYLRIRLTDDGADQLADLLEEAKARPKEIRVDGLPILVGRIDLKRRELRVTIQGLDDDRALVLTERLNDKRARVEVIETAGK